MKQLFVYTDGSIQKGILGYGFVVLSVHLNSKRKLIEDVLRESCGRVKGPKDYLSMRNVAAEIEAVKKAFEWLKKSKYWSSVEIITLVHDYFELQAWPLGLSYPVKKYTKLYTKKMLGYMKERNIEFEYVKGHSGNERWNDRADELAKIGARGEKIV